jgi:mono/diheme cytochrome c family protein/nitrate reductase gamma subunit
MSLRLMNWRCSTTIFVVFSMRFLLVTGGAQADATEEKKLFTQRCMACHTFGKGVKVGPDLKGVTERRERPWLQRFIRSSQSVIGEGDPTAKALFQQFNQQQMPDWTDLTEPQISSLLDWFSVDGPEQRDPNNRPASDASLAELEHGRRLFHGVERFAAGGIACASCHPIRDDIAVVGASLAVDLSSSYIEYQDGSLAQLLQRPCSKRIPESTASTFLTPQEAYALKAYLSSGGRPRAGRGDHAPALGAAEAGDGGASDAAPARGAVAELGALPGRPRAPRWSPRAAAIGAAPQGHAPANGTWVFAYLPYGAIVLFVVGMLLRGIRARGGEHTLRDAVAAVKDLYRGRDHWWVGLGVVLLLHLLILCAPQRIVWWGSAPLRLYGLEVTGWLAGLLAFVGWGQRSWRYLQRRAVPSGERSRELGDALVFAVLGVALGSGLILALADRWASLWATATLAPYLRSLPSGAPIGGLVEQMPLVVRLHVLSWFALIAVLPASRVADVLIFALERAARAALRPVEAGLHALARLRGRVNLARWLWPEEDTPIEPAGAATLAAGALLHDRRPPTPEAVVDPTQPQP